VCGGGVGSWFRVGVGWVGVVGVGVVGWVGWGGGGER